MTENKAISRDPTSFIIKTTQKKQVVDITDKVNGLIKDSEKDFGVVQLNLLHTTAALTVADLDPGTDKDYLDAFEAMVPDLDYRHPHDSSHVWEHIISAIVGTDLNLSFENSQLVLGTWQSVILVELGGPKERKINFSMLS